MGKTDDITLQKLNPQLKLNKRISKLPVKPTLSPSSEAKVNIMHRNKSIFSPPPSPQMENEPNSHRQGGGKY